jgi:diguanylate cyclase (GGDEF)-like protein
VNPEQLPAVAGTDTLALCKRQHRAFVNARLILVSAFIGLWLLMFPLRLTLPTGFLVALLAEAGTLVMYGWLVRCARSARTLDWMHYALLTVEIGFHSAMVYYLGGVSWLGSIAYIYAVLFAAAFLNRWQTVVFTAGVAAASLTFLSLEGAGVIPHQSFLPQGPDRLEDPRFLATSAIMFVGVLGTIAFWVAWLGSEVRRERDDALKANAELVDTQTQLQTLNEELELKVAQRTEALLRRAEADQLTGLLNRGAITSRLRDLLALAQRGGRPLAVVMADGDKFKLCNDRGGHDYGDEVLRMLAEGLTRSCRESDVVGRMGGDEFLIILPDTSLEGALQFSCRVAEYIAQMRLDWPHDGLPVPSFSFGAAVCPADGSEVDELIQAADRAMYEAKRAGGGRWGCAKVGASPQRLTTVGMEG